VIIVTPPFAARRMGQGHERVRVREADLDGQVLALADELRLKLHVCHFPPGASKWNRIEHRLFSFITQNWRGRPLVSHQAIINLIAGTTAKTGLIVKAALDTKQYDTKLKVTDQELSRIRLVPHPFHGDWNYTLSPRRKM